MEPSETFEERILGGFPEKQDIDSKIYHSGIYQPDRILLSSTSDNSPGTIGTLNMVPENTFNQFRITLPRPAIEVKSIELIRASIPNPVANIPDPECTFWYWRIPNSLGTWTNSVFQNQAYLYFVRLLPSYYTPDTLQAQVYTASTRFGFNRTFQDYTDLATELAKSCLHDPTESSGSNFISGDITITYNSTLNKFQFAGTNSAFYYMSAGINQPALLTAQQTLQALSITNDYKNPTLVGFPAQPYQAGRTLNLRLGFSWNGANSNFFFVAGVPQNAGKLLMDRFRPQPNYSSTQGTSTPTPVVYTAEYYANLVYTNCVNVYMDIVGNSSLDSENNQNLLASVPMNTANLGVTFFSPIISSPLQKLQTRDIYTLQVSLFDDVGNPFYISNCGVVSLELGIKYFT